MTREERRASTRADLLDAAAKVFARQGFNGASVDDVAAEAGYTSGAVYSNFAGKEELFLAAFEDQVARHVRTVAEAQAEADDTPRARARASAHRWVELLRGNPEMFLLVAEYWAYAVRDRKVRPQFAERFGAFRDFTARNITAEAERAGWDLPLAPEDLAVGINALLYGFALQYLTDPDDMDDTLLAELTTLFFGGAREAARGAGP